MNTVSTVAGIDYFAADLLEIATNNRTQSEILFWLLE
jgi:hypothetical protein